MSFSYNKNNSHLKGGTKGTAAMVRCDGLGKEKCSRKTRARIQFVGGEPAPLCATCFVKFMKPWQKPEPEYEP